MVTEVKICGLTRAGDAATAARSGASYVGVIFAKSSRQLKPERAAEVLGGTEGTGVRRVGVFDAGSASEILRTAEVAQLDVLQLHHATLAECVPELRRSFAGEVWGVVRVDPQGLGPSSWDQWEGVDAIVLDTYSPSALGGTGRIFDWDRAANEVRERRGSRRLVLAGGLNTANVGKGIAALRPDVVDVSSGVERRLGEKDPELVAKFVRAVRQAGA